MTHPDMPSVKYRDLLKFPEGVKCSVRQRGEKVYVSASGNHSKVLRMCITSVFPYASMTSGGGDCITMRINPDESHREFYMELNWGLGEYARKYWPKYTVDALGVGIISPSSS